MTNFPTFVYSPYPEPTLKDTLLSLERDFSSISNTLMKALEEKKFIENLINEEPTDTHKKVKLIRKRRGGADLKKEHKCEIRGC